MSECRLICNFATMKKETGSIIEICPVRNVVARFGDKWSLLVLLIIDGAGTVRFKELERMIPDISAKMLAKVLRTLAADALVSRKVYAEVPPKVEYSLTETGKSLIPLIRQLTDWALRNMEHIMEHRRRFESAR